MVPAYDSTKMNASKWTARVSLLRGEQSEEYKNVKIRG